MPGMADLVTAALAWAPSGVAEVPRMRGGGSGFLALFERSRGATLRARTRRGDCSGDCGVTIIAFFPRQVIFPKRGAVMPVSSLPH
jgi:hypothetical protein